MEYPKRIMTRKALITQMGFSEAYLMRAFSTPVRHSPGGRTR